jgi:hypothetical protein
LRRLDGQQRRDDTGGVPLRNMLRCAALLAAALVGGGFFDGHFL